VILTEYNGDDAFLSRFINDEDANTYTKREIGVLAMRIKSFICGFLAACLMLTCLYVFADTGFTRQIKATVGGVDIVMDGVKLFPKDADGKPVLPVAFDNTTYVPIRFLTAVLHKKLVRVGDTIYIGEEQTAKAIYLSELTPVVKSENWNQYGLMGGWLRTPNPYDGNYASVSYSKAASLKIANKDYLSVSTILCDGRDGIWGLYNLDGKYTKLTGYFGIDDASTDEGRYNGKFEVFGDGKRLLSMNKTRGSAPQYFEIPLKDVKLLNISLTGACTSRQFYNQYFPVSQTICDLYDLTLYY
jgi:hypothetical protein